MGFLPTIMAKTDTVFKEIVFVSSAGLVYFISRLINLTLLPIFTDEAIYLRWSFIIWHDAERRFIPLSDGKPPLFMWLTVPFLKIFSNPLFAGRFLSVLIGFTAMLGLFLLGKKLFSQREAYLAVILYLVNPFTLMYDRMALTESLLLALLIYFLYFLVRLVKEVRLDWALLAGGFWGLSLLTKPTAFFFALFFLFAFLLLKRPLDKRRLFKMVMLFAVAGIIALALFYLQILSPYLRRIFSRSQDYAFTWQEILKDPLWQTGQVASTIWQWSFAYFTPFVWLGFVAIAIWGLLKKLKPVWFLFLCFFSLYFIHALTGKVIYPRYFNLFAPFVFLLFAWGVNRLWKRQRLFILRVTAGLIIFAPQLYFNLLLIFNPLKAPFVKIDRWQYLSSWASGIGVYETAQFLRSEASQEKIMVLIEGGFGNPHDGLQSFLDGEKNIVIEVASQPVFGVPEEYLSQSDKVKTFLVVNKSRWAIRDDDSRFKLIKVFPKVPYDGEQDELRVYRIKI